MKVLELPVHLASKDMARKKPDSPPPAVHQMSIRVPHELFRRIQAVAEALVLDPTSVVRLVLAENLADYEERAGRLRHPKER